jgi:starch synthase
VRRTGGLKDTVIDFEEEGGYGICYNHTVTGDITQSVWRAVELYRNKKKLNANREIMMKLDFDWKTSVQKYIDVYERLI